MDEITLDIDIPEQKMGYLSPFQQKFLQENLAKKLHPKYRRRIEIMLLADQGKSQTEICNLLNCAHETARFWILMARTGQAHQWKTIPIGRPKTINQVHLNRLQHLIQQSPRDCGYAFSRWTAKWLSRHLANEFNIQISERHVNRLLKQMGLSTQDKQIKKEVNHQAKVGINNTKNKGINIKNLDTKYKPKTLYFSPFSQKAL
ncbi:MAG: winged helix-turn-helix domain-containing protein [Cyanobacteria bacterium P01_G01_bin.39]